MTYLELHLFLLNNTNTAETIVYGTLNPPNAHT